MTQVIKLDFLTGVLWIHLRLLEEPELATLRAAGATVEVRGGIERCLIPESPP